MYICPGCCLTSKKSWGNCCPVCNYEVEQKSFPTIQRLIEGTTKFREGDWNNVNIPLFSKTLIEKAIELNLIQKTYERTRF